MVDGAPRNDDSSRYGKFQSPHEHSVCFEEAGRAVRKRRGFELGFAGLNCIRRMDRDRLRNMTARI